MGNTLFTMNNPDFYSKLLIEMLCKVLCGIDAPMLASCTSKGKHQIRKPSLQITGHMRVGQPIHTVKKGQYFTIIFQKSDNGFIQSCKILVWLVPSRIMGTATIKDISPSISRFIFRYTFPVRKTEYPDDQWSFSIISGESGRTIVFMRRINVMICSPVSIRT